MTHQPGRGDHARAGFVWRVLHRRQVGQDDVGRDECGAP